MSMWCSMVVVAMMMMVLSPGTGEAHSEEALTLHVPDTNDHSARRLRSWTFSRIIHLSMPSRGEQGVLRRDNNIHNSVLDRCLLSTW